MIYLYVAHHWRYDRQVPHYDRVYRVISYQNFQGKPNKVSISSGPVGTALKKGIPGIAASLQMLGDKYTVAYENQTSIQMIHFAEADFFDFFGFPALEGKPEKALQHPQQVVISAKMARRFFGFQPAIGQELRIELYSGFRTFKVGAVIPDPQITSSIQYEIIVPLSILLEDMPFLTQEWTSLFVVNFIKLKPGANPLSVEKALHQRLKTQGAQEIKQLQKKAKSPQWIEFKLQPLAQVHINDQIVNQNGVEAGIPALQLYALAGLGLFLLLIAAINYTNLSLALAFVRSKEIGVRKILGATRNQIRQQFLSETLLMGFLAILGAFVLAEWMLPFFYPLLKTPLSLYEEGPQILFPAFILVVFISLLAGLYPAVVLSSWTASLALQKKIKLGQGTFLSRALVVLQFSFSTFFLLMALIFYFQLQFILQKPLGFEAEGLIYLKTPRNQAARYLPLLAKDLRQHPEITGFSAQNEGTTINQVQIGHKKALVASYRTEPNFPALMQIRLLSGRLVRPDASDRQQSVLVNEAFVRAFALQKTLGKKFKAWLDPWNPQLKREVQIVGVVANYHFEPFYKPIAPAILHCNEDLALGALWFRVAPGQESLAMHTLEKLWKKYEPFRPLITQTAREILEKPYQAEYSWQLLLRAAALLAIMISLLGLSGLLRLSLNQRIKEIGIRKTLGASIWALVWHLNRHFLQQTLLGIALGLGLGLLVGHYWLSHFFYTLSLWHYLPAFLVLGTSVALLTAFTVTLQTYQASSQNPVLALRYE
ncbi:MAG: ABC transporter permease [Microscillaceae bacterium]